MALTIGINGFGRIGRCAFRVASADAEVEVVGINDLVDPATLAHLLTYDSIHGRFAGDVAGKDGVLTVNGSDIPVSAERAPENLPWKKWGADVVLECTGLFTKRDNAAAHLTAGARKVIISAPAGDADATLAMGINHDSYDASKHDVVSNASCTTNCLAPIAKVLHDSFGIESGLMTTIHAYTADQRLQDAPHKDLRRARAAAVSMIPTTTGAAKAVGLVLPELAGKLDGLAVRVPTADVSLTDLSATVSRTVTKDDVNDAMKASAHGALKGILQYCDEPLVSIDFLGNPHSSIFDAGATYVAGGSGTMVKVLAWYDNEWGYSNRLIDLAKHIAR